MKSARKISGFLVVIAFAFSWLFTFTCINRLRLYYNRDRYRPAVFVVDGAEYFRSSNLLPYWLTGSIEGQPERLIPGIPRDHRPKSQEELLARFPVGSEIDVLYNPEESATLVQGESLRVLQSTPTFWSDEERLRTRLLMYVFVPGPVLLLIYLCLRFLDRFISSVQAEDLEKV